MLSLVFALFAVATSAWAISWPLILDAGSTGGNVWIELTYTIHVPQGPPSTVTTGPWFFWCGLQPQGGGVVQPVLQWGEDAPGYVNPNAPFPHIWAMVLWDVPASGLNNDVSRISNGVWAAQGDQIANSASFNSGFWTQTASVISGQATGASTSTNITANQYFHDDAAHDGGANFFLCESELDGQQTNQWNFPVLFTDIFIRAKNSNGVQALCASARPFSDGNGFANMTGFSMFDANTCHFASLVLTPP
ncbi:hypothetical protein AURDEDRAFT_116945 [Auricularia subglabra TFB-10046 SS5]|uniref:Concanavalin A-like lectin/glucanase n=1 Tax=Auricularia subglabra (strain TFB-10046 / SS5) TaxID=717982 RepID=J0LGS7_AURST|nr:hypothetical protein AURDEDRAFT_116945 [Auricularia subglabra TFB-10046 SS5]